jgi:phospholipid/cholesterol/gamma-HCH transport system permease protein
MSSGHNATSGSKDLSALFEPANWPYSESVLKFLVMRPEKSGIPRENDWVAHFTTSVTAGLALIGRLVIAFVRNSGAMAIFFSLSFVNMFSGKQGGEILRQLFQVSVKSTGIVVFVALFTGMVLGLQLFNTLVRFGSQGAIGSAIALSLVRELGPVLAAIMVTARAGSGMTTEIGIQRISEQIDALYVMGIDPIRYLISPRLAASLIGLPLLTAFFDIVGIVGGYLTAVILLKTNGGTYIYGLQYSVTSLDVRVGFVKAVVFAVIIATVCCFQGYFCHMRTDSSGAKAVGLATRSAVVLSSTLILVSDYAVTSLLM